jgi:ferredoxin
MVFAAAVRPGRRRDEQRREREQTKEKRMKARVTEDCIACGRCIEICPEVFEMGEDIAHVKVDVVPQEYEDATQEAADECPTSAIIIER